MNSDTENSSNKSSTDISDREWDMIDLVIMEVADGYDRRFLNRQPYHNDPFTGREYVERVLDGHPKRCSDLHRMKKEVLFDLADGLKCRELLKDTRYVTVEEQLCIFLYTIRHTVGNRVVADKFQHSQETISRHFGKVLKAICRFSKEIILPPDMNTPHPHVMSKGDKYYPWFQNCICAIDGTHVNTFVPSGKKQIPYRGRKTVPTENVMCACDFNMNFTFVLAGWEGTANDSRVFGEALSNPNLKFPHPPEGKYYLVNSGYPIRPGYLTPYKGDHIILKNTKDIEDCQLPRTAKEKFNFVHSSLRNVIERTFGVLKVCFPILTKLPNFSLRKQRNIVIATCTVHNYIRKHNIQDDQNLNKMTWLSLMRQAVMT